MDSSRRKILTVSKEPELLEKLKTNLITANYNVQTAEESRQAFELINQNEPDAIIIGDLLADCSGLDFCGKIRSLSKYDEILVLLLSRLKNDFMHIESLRSGADDFICYPVSFEILRGRLTALFRRVKKKQRNIVNFNSLYIDPFQFLVTVHGKKISLAKKEFEVLYLLASREGELISRTEILERIWGEIDLASDRTIDVHIRKIRKKLGLDCISTVKGIGYKFAF